MQNRYVGDIADFGKHGLLRFLSGENGDGLGELQIGLIWYMYHDEQHGADRKKIVNAGKFTGYLERTPKNTQDYRVCDADLWEKLHDLIRHRKARCVHCAESSGLLPDRTAYYGAELGFVPGLPRKLKEDTRAHWWAEALQATEGTALVCCDPDNGIAPCAVGMYRRDGPKYVYLSDLQALWERKQSLVIYQHLGMDRPAREQIRDKAAWLESEFGSEPISLRFRKGTSRVFFVVPHPESGHGDTVRARANRFSEGLWVKKRYFERVCTTPEEEVSI